MKIKNEKGFFAGLMFLGIGLAAALVATSYRLGDASRMGPGYFPLLVGGAMAILGIVITCKALMVETEGGDKIDYWAWKPLVCVLAANFVFGVLLCGLPSIKLPAMGLIIAISALVIISSLAGVHFKLRSVLILTTILAVGCYLTFVVLLKMELPLWPDFIG